MFCMKYRDSSKNLQTGERIGLSTGRNSVIHIKRQFIAAERSEECPCSFAALHLKDKEFIVMLSPFVQGEKAAVTILNL